MSNKENNIAITVVGATGLPSFTLTGYKIYWSSDASNYKTQGEMLQLPVMLPGKLLHVVLQNNYNKYFKNAVRLPVFFLSFLKKKR